MKAIKMRHRPTIITAFAGLLIWLPASGWPAQTSALLSTCDQSAFELELAPALKANQKTDSQAIWLNRSTLAWPQSAESGKFKIYYSAAGRIKIQNGQTVSGSDGFLALDAFHGELPKSVLSRFSYIPAGVELNVRPIDIDRLQQLHKQQLILVREDHKGKVLDFTNAQIAGAMDDMYRSAESIADLGVTFGSSGTQFKLWAPTAKNVDVCVYVSAKSKAHAKHPMQWNTETGAWSFNAANRMEGEYYRYLVDVFVPNHGLVRNAVTDPYSISLSTNSERSYIADLNSEHLKPSRWDQSIASQKVKHQTDMVIYELHVRDFSINDQSVNQANRGKYLAFTELQSNGMKHLHSLSKAGLTDVHLLPVFDIATIPEQGCISPNISGAANSEQQQAAIKKTAASDCFNWGYDPYHFNAPEGSYASNAEEGATRIIELRQMVKSLHDIGLRVGMDVVYNHTSTSGQKEKSVLDRIVPGYYQRLNGNGEVEHSTCCDNTATENLMMGKLMLDSTVLWAKQYKIDSFRFDLMGHQPRNVMEALQQRVNLETGRQINLIGEGWNFGEIANGKRFVQASQLSLNGSGIGTFSDRARDAVRGGRAGENGLDLVKNQGYINGLSYDPNEANIGINSHSELLKTADMIRVGLAGSILDYNMQDHTGATKRLNEIAYGDQPAGYVSQPTEVVNYVDNHDNQTLFDINVYKLPLNTSIEDRARVQVLGIAINAFSQGVAYFHAGIETLRSKSMDGNSYDSGDWFNRLDWTLQDNYFAIGMPPKQDNGNNHAFIKPRLENASIKPGAEQIKFTRDAFSDLLKIRSSSSLFRLASADDIKKRLKFYNTGAEQNPVLVVGHLSNNIQGQPYKDANFKELLYFINVATKAQQIKLTQESHKPYVLHPVHLNADAADKRPAQQAKYQAKDGTFIIPARTAVVLVIKEAYKP